MIQSSIKEKKKKSLTGPRGPPTDLLPRFPKYEGVKSGPMFIILAGSAGRSGVLFTWRKRPNNFRIEITTGYYNGTDGTHDITDLVQNHVADTRKAFGFVHTGTDELAA